MAEEAGQPQSPKTSPVPKPQLIGRGSTSWVYKITSQIAVKISCQDHDPREWDQEMRACEILADAHPRCPFIMDSYLRLPLRFPKAHFVEMIPPLRTTGQDWINNNLWWRLHQHQKRAQDEDEGHRVLAVTSYEKPDDVNRWIAQVCAAAAWLESVLGMAHGDISTSNVVIDANGDARLIDFNRMERVGCDNFLGTGPYARRVRDGELEEGPGEYGYGCTGPRTETFALGSLIFALVYGHEPYETEYWGRETGPIRGAKLKNMEFPKLTGSTWDGVIEDCWFGRFESVTALRDEVLRKTGQDLESLTPSQSSLNKEEAIRECARLLDAGVLDLIELPNWFSNSK